MITSGLDAHTIASIALLFNLSIPSGFRATQEAHGIDPSRGPLSGIGRLFFPIQWIHAIQYFSTV